MKRRVYFNDPKRQRLKQEFLASYRKARKAMDPKLLEEARQSIFDALKRLDQKEDRAAGNDRRQEPEKKTVPIDRKQNLSVIMKYLEMNPHNTYVREQLQSVLREDL